MVASAGRDGDACSVHEKGWRPGGRPPSVYRGRGVWIRGLGVGCGKLVLAIRGDLRQPGDDGLRKLRRLRTHGI